MRDRKSGVGIQNMLAAVERLGVSGGPILQTCVSKTYCEIHVDVLEVQQDCEEKPAGELVSLQQILSRASKVFENEMWRTFRAMRIDQSRMPNMNPLY